MNTFEIGKTYSCKSVCDHDAKWGFTVIDRTGKFIVILSDEGKSFKKGIKIDSGGSEYVFPLGTYSMAPILRA